MIIGQACRLATRETCDRGRNIGSFKPCEGESSSEAYAAILAHPRLRPSYARSKETACEVEQPDGFEGSSLKRGALRIIVRTEVHQP